MPIWKPFMDWMAAWALPGLSKLTKPAGGREREKPQRSVLDAGRADTMLKGGGVTDEWGMSLMRQSF